MSGRQRLKLQCPQCGSRRFRRDAETSLVVCAYGHVLQNYRQEENDAGEEYAAGASQSQRRRRTIRKQKNVRARDLQHNRINVYEWKGQRGRFHHLRCLQYLLRLQIVAMRQAYPGLPQQFEQVAKEFWMYTVSLMKGIHAPPFADEEQNTAPSRTASRSSSLARASQADIEAIMEEEQQENEHFDRDMRELGLGDSDSEDGGKSASMNSVRADSEQSDSDADSVEGTRSKASASTFTARQPSRSPPPMTIDTLLNIIYLSLVYLRVPVMWTDIRSLIWQRKLPYLHAVYTLPVEMSRRLSHIRCARWDITRVASTSKLHKRASKLANKLNQSFDIVFPPLNALPLLWRCTERLLLPATYYRAAKRFLAYLDLPIFPVSATAASYDDPPGTQYTKARRHRARLTVPYARDKRLMVAPRAEASVAREVVLISVVIIIAKLRYGLDGEERMEEAFHSDHWSGAPHLLAWLEALDKAKDNLALSDVRAFSDHPEGINDLLALDEQELDRYLDYAERSLTHDHHLPQLHDGGRRQTPADLLTAVDAGPDAHSQYDHRRTFNVEQHMASLYDGDHPVAPTHVEELGADVLRPGEAHIVYARVGKSSVSPAHASLVHPSYAKVMRYASLIVDCEPEEISDTIYSLEHHLAKQLTQRRNARNRDIKRSRKDEEGQENDDDDVDDDDDDNDM